MSYHQSISRRTMLRGSGVALSLPLLDAMAAPAVSVAAASSKPVRLAYLYIPNGVAEGAWEPEKVAKNGELLKLNRFMEPLDDFKSDIIIPRKVWTPRGNGHSAGTATWLTGHGYDGRQINAGGRFRRPDCR